MSKEPTTPVIKHKSGNPTVVGIVMTLVALIAPLAFFLSDYDGLYISLIAVLWSFTSSSYYTSLVIADILTLSMSLPFGFLRFAYAYQMVRLYKGRTTKKRTLTLGIVSELPFAILFIPNLIMWLLTPYGPMALGGPTLILLIVGILIVRFRPPPETPEIWEDLSEEKSWWETQSEEESVWEEKSEEEP
ncbi:MAG: hypothetical protein KAU89_04285 [Candidatus Thorarchaeota archaeon]|nr:hypothetical protein [Candidatus Thorarchaeota archaeon]